MYHAVGTPVPGDVQGRYNIQNHLFATHMRLLATDSRPLVPFSAGFGEGVAVDGISVTFDDGYRDNFTTAYPLLQSLAIPFTIFVTADHIRSGEAIYLRPAELREMARDPLVNFGAHGATHRRLTELKDAELRAELRDSRSYLEDILGRAVDSMSYPHGCTNPRVRAAVTEAGFLLAAGSKFGINDSTSDPHCLRRTDIWAADREADLGIKLDGGWDWLGSLTRS
jgi:peptidoglycan/xylan/chitin deacetylase (PgdA/CDA1 family)